MGGLDAILGSRARTTETLPVELASAIGVTLTILVSIPVVVTSCVRFTEFGSNDIVALTNETGLSALTQTSKELSGGNVQFSS